MEKHLQAASLLAYLLDNKFRIGKFRFGLSALLDLAPGIGDITNAILSLYIVWIAFKMKVPALIIMRMVGNIAINFLIGLVPVFGDIVYLFRKVNVKNLALIKKYAMKTA